MHLTFKIDEKELLRELIKIFIPEINKVLKRAIQKLKPKIGNIVKNAIVDSPEVESLFGGKLQAELGVTDTVSRVDSILELLGNSVDIDFSPAQVKQGLIYASVQLGYIKADYSDILSTKEAQQDTKRGQTLFWLEWLLLEGDKVIVQDYNIGFDLAGYSRTGLGKIMIGGKNRKWSVPPEFSGTKNDNFITRSLHSVDVAVETALAEALK